MAEEHFSITYNGRSVQAGRISVRDLAPSLIALADTVSAASRLIQPEVPEPGLEIKAQRPGSFAVDLIINAERQIWPAIQEGLLRPQVAAGLVLSSLVASIFGAIRFVSWAKGRKIKSNHPVANGQVRITMEDGTTIDLPKDSLTLAGDIVFRRAAREVIEPLARQSVTDIRLERESIEPVILTSEDVSSFDKLGEKKLLHRSTSRKVLQPVLVAFQPGNKWRFTDGQIKFYATVEDERFLAKIKSGVEEFVSTDHFLCDVKTETWQLENGTAQTERTILRVVEHNRASHQMFFDEIIEDDSHE